MKQRGTETPDSWASGTESGSSCSIVSNDTGVVKVFSSVFETSPRVSSSFQMDERSFSISMLADFLA